MLDALHGNQHLLMGQASLNKVLHTYVLDARSIIIQISVLGPKRNISKQKIFLPNPLQSKNILNLAF